MVRFNFAYKRFLVVKYLKSVKEKFFKQLGKNNANNLKYNKINLLHISRIKDL